MASLSEHRDKIQAAINAAEADGFTTRATTCCCGEGLVIHDGETAWSANDVLDIEVGY